MIIVHPDLNVKKRVLQSGINDVTILLMWAREDGVSYNVSIAPHATTRFIENTVVEIRVPYNTQHRVSIIASQCGRNISTAVTTLNYGELHTFILLWD